MEQIDMKNKPILNLIIKMSLPIIISMIINALYNIVDSFFVAKVSDEAMTAISYIFPLQYLANACGIGFGVAIASLTAFYYGANKKEEAIYSASKGVILSIIHGIVITIFSLLVAKPFLMMYRAASLSKHNAYPYSLSAPSRISVVNLLAIFIS